MLFFRKKSTRCDTIEIMDIKCVKNFESIRFEKKDA
jgi:hypothetical protein